MTIYNYLFKDTHNGHYSTYQPFTSEKKLTQEKADEFIYMNNDIAGRMGSDISDLIISANKNGYNIKVCCLEFKITEKFDEYNNIYKNIEELKDEFKNWEIIRGISGNY